MSLPSRASIALVLLAATLPGCVSGTAPEGPPSAPTIDPNATPIPTSPLDLPPCDPPKEIAFPDWYPEDLPKPDGLYASQKLKPSFGYLRGLFVVPGQLEDLQEFVLDAWPEAGWILGRGDAEPGEIEDTFSKAPAVGAFKAQFAFCKPGFSFMYLIYAKKRPSTEVVPTPTSTSTGVPLVPTPTPT